LDDISYSIDLTCNQSHGQSSNQCVVEQLTIGGVLASPLLSAKSGCTNTARHNKAIHMTDSYELFNRLLDYYLLIKNERGYVAYRSD
jgi:hypothetical protein